MCLEVLCSTTAHTTRKLKVNIPNGTIWIVDSRECALLSDPRSNINHLEQSGYSKLPMLQHPNQDVLVKLVELLNQGYGWASGAIEQMYTVVCNETELPSLEDLGVTIGDPMEEKLPIRDVLEGGDVLDVLGGSSLDARLGLH